MTQQEKNPWTTLNTEKIYDNPWIALEEDKVINPAGGQGIYGVVKFKNQAIGVIPVDDEGNTWLVGQYRYPLKKYSWEIPMGGQPVGQLPEEGAYRELAEETGLRAERLTQILKVDLSNCVSDEVGYVFIAEGLTQGETDFDETEDLAIKKLPLKEAVNMALDGRIEDGLSVTGLLKLAIVRNLLD